MKQEAFTDIEYSFRKLVKYILQTEISSVIIELSLHH